MLLGNKCDLPDREVPYNVAMEYARSKNFGFLEVSAKTGMNIKSAFTCLVRGKYNENNLDRNIQELKRLRRRNSKEFSKHY